MSNYLELLVTGLKKLANLGGAPVSLPGAGLHHFLIKNDVEQSRVHLRIDPDGSGLLIVNANRIMHLNPTAVLLSFMALKNVGQAQAVSLLCREFDVDPIHATNDYAKIRTQIEELVRPDGACPVHDLELETIAPFSRQPAAPFRMDLAVTYRCNNNCAHCYNARERNFPELTTDQWFKILDHLWSIGIPHVVFTGGEPTLRHDLPRLIAHAEKNGQITGVNTNGRKFSDPDYLKTLVDAGLDHVQFTLESHDAGIHDRMVQHQGAWAQTIRGLQNALGAKLYVMTNTTMLQENSVLLQDTLNYLGELGVPTVGLNALIYSGHGATVGTGLPESALQPLLEIARESTQRYQQRLIWYTPTEYCKFDPMQLDLGIKGCTAALYNMCIEPNGDVLPCQSYYTPVGNILNNSWSSIWDHELCQNLRQRRYIQEKCNGCSLLTECGGGCPLQLQVNTKELVTL